MADIDIQEKKPPVWPWILAGLLALIVLFWAGAEMFDGDEDFAVADTAVEQTPATAPEPAGQTETGMPTAVTQFEEECASPGTTTDEMSLDHTYVADCIRQMTAAMEAVIERDTVADQPLSDQLEDYRARAERLTENRDSPDHSSYLRDVFDGAAQVIATIEETRESAGETLDRRSDRVQGAAEAVTADVPVMEQRDEVAAFLREAAEALRALAMNQGRS